MLLFPTIMPIQDFSYEALPNLVHAFQIRLLEFRPPSISTGSDAAFISCRLAPYNIQATPPFIALSYTWGPPSHATQGSKQHETILVNDGKVEVTKNLEEALKSIKKRCELSSSGRPPLFWIDSICINQKDLQERSIQVNMMGQIYSKASQVWIWLGLPEGIQMDTTRSLVGKLARASRDIQSQRTSKGIKPSFSDADWDTVTDKGRLLKKYNPPSWRSRAWVDLALLLQRNWWSRVWILQEVALAPQAEILCGDYSLPWHEIRLCSDLLMAGLDSQLDHRLNVRKKSTSGVLPAGSGLVTLDGICRMVESRENVELLGSICSYLTGNSTISSPAIALSVLLHLSRGWNATDPKDQVYALLGLVPAVVHPSALNRADHQIFKADYGKSDREVFIQCATWIIEQTRWLGYLTLVEDRNVQSNMELPTWVPDLSKVPPMRLGTQVDIVRNISLLRGQAHRKRGTTFPKVFGGILHCAGTRMGTITQISTPIIDLCNGLSTFEEGAKIVLSSPQIYPYTKERRDDVFWKTLMGCESTEINMKHHFGRFWLRILIQISQASGVPLEEFLKTIPSIDALGRSVPDSSFPTCKEIRELVTSSDISPSSKTLQGALARESGAFEGILRKTAVCRRLFLTDKNHLGICPSSSRPGDEVWFLAHAPTPFILHKADSRKSWMYSLKGHAYVHGFVSSILPTVEVEDSNVTIG